MLKKETRERLQALVQHPKFEGSIHIADKKYPHNEGEVWNEVSIHGEGFNVFTLLAELFPDMALSKVESYENEVVFLGIITFGSKARGRIEGAEVNVWAKYGEKPIEKAPTAIGTEEITHIHLNTYESIAEMVEREA